MLVHFNDLKQDLPGEIRHIAAFLGIPVDEQRWPAILEHCSFPYMQAHADKVAPLGGVPWEGGAQTFIYKGTNGRWRNVLTPEEIDAYERIIRERLGADCAHWLATGEMPHRPVSIAAN